MGNLGVGASVHMGKKLLRSSQSAPDENTVLHAAHPGKVFQEKAEIQIFMSNYQINFLNVGLWKLNKTQLRIAFSYWSLVAIFKAIG